jgi:hypothetical protein
MRKRLGLGVAPFCVVDQTPTLADKVTHGDMQKELDRLRAAVTLLATCCGAHVIDSESGKRLLKLLAPPHERAGGVA